MTHAGALSSVIHMHLHTLEFLKVQILCQVTSKEIPICSTTKLENLETEVKLSWMLPYWAWWWRYSTRVSFAPAKQSRKHLENIQLQTNNSYKFIPDRIPVTYKHHTESRTYVLSTQDGETELVVLKVQKESYTARITCVSIRCIKYERKNNRNPPSEASSQHIEWSENRIAANIRIWRIARCDHTGLGRKNLQKLHSG